MDFPALPATREVHLWTLPHGEGNSQLLTAKELNRLGRYHHAKDQRRYGFTQSAKRKILARYLGLLPESLDFLENEYGKPSLPGLEFSISHTAGQSALAIASDQPIGLDIENLAPQADLSSLARHILTEQEWEFFQQLPDSEQLPWFYRFWTAKEAYLKNLGTGFTIEPSAIEVALPIPSSIQGKNQASRVLLEHPTTTDSLLQLATEFPIHSCHEFFYPDYFGFNPTPQ